VGAARAESGRMMAMKIIVDDLHGSEITALLRDHLAACIANSPPGSMHALDIDALRSPGVTFWSAWDGGELLGCGALRELDSVHAEVKSMRTATAHLRKGVASAIVAHLIDEAKRRGYRRLSLETGSQDEFAPARRLYMKFGFVECGPFGAYVQDPNSTFMTRAL
jgi:putative acetyltransferase